MDRFILALNMLPAILQLVRLVEVLIPGQGRGKEKLNVVLATVGAAADSAPAVVDAIDKKDLAGTITAVTNAAVSSLNAAGALKQPQDSAGHSTEPLPQQ